MSDRQRLAWKLAKMRFRVITLRGYPERLRQRDYVGTTLADFVSLAKLLFVVATDRGIPNQTEVERRAIVCARRRLQAMNKRSSS